MKRIILSGLSACLLASTAYAADMPVPYTKAPPRGVEVPYSWAGLYVGLDAGYGWSNEPTTIGGGNDLGSLIVATGLVPNTLKTDARGAVFGGEIGYGWQTGQIYYGLALDLHGADVTGSDSQLLTLTPFRVPVSLTTSSEQKLGWFGTFRPRLGYAVYDRALIYVTGGLAFGEVTDSTTVELAAPTPLGAIASASTQRTAVGWTIGGGIETMIAQGWGAKVEYRYMDLGSTNQTLSTNVLGAPVSFTASQDDKFHIVTAGITKHF